MTGSRQGLRALQAARASVEEDGATVAAFAVFGFLISRLPRF